MAKKKRKVNKQGRDILIALPEKNEKRPRTRIGLASNKKPKLLGV